MTLKSACKTAIVLMVISIILILVGQIFSSMMFFSRMSGDQNGWSTAPGGPRYLPYLILMQLLNSVTALLHPGLLLAGFITLLSACLKRLNNPQANVKKRYIVATVLIGLAALVMTWLTVGFFWNILRHSPPQNLQLGLSLCWYLIATLCAISLCIFAATGIRKIAARTPTVLAIVCHWLMVAVTIAGTANTLHHVLTINSTQHFGPLFSIFWFASSVLSYSGDFLWLAAVLLFLYAYLKNLSLRAGVIEPLPEPLPTLSAEQSLPGEDA